jgi:hypothetical protein
MPTNPQCTFSPTALKHYLHYSTHTIHLECLHITTSTGQQLSLPSIRDHSINQLLDSHKFIVVKPKTPSALPSTLPPQVFSATSESSLNHLLAHQCLAHNSDEVLDTMCRKQSLLGLPNNHFLLEVVVVLFVSPPNSHIHLKPTLHHVN